jgi:CO/xanthine dehydrogenase Mo-binding subunit
MIAWESEAFIPDGIASFVALVGADLAGLDSLGKLSPGNILNDLAIPYGFANVKTTAHRLASTPLKPSWIRSPGRLQNTFANESFLDEIAAQTEVDPLELRLRYLDDPRGQELLERLASFSKWRARPKPDRSAEVVTGRGLAYVKYELVRTYVGAVAQVEVNRKTGEIAVTRFHVVHDCGQIINPDGLRNQIEGNIIQTVSRTLKEKVTFDRSMVTSLDWVSYPILTFPDIPDVVIDLIDRPNEAPLGRRRAIGGDRARGDQQRRLRGDGRAASVSALHSGEGQGRARDGMTKSARLRCRSKPACERECDVAGLRFLISMILSATGFCRATLMEWRGQRSILCCRPRQNRRRHKSRCQPFTVTGAETA